MHLQLNIFAVVDNQGRFTFYDLGSPGSEPDSAVFKKSTLWKSRHTYFNNDEYILVDKGI